MAAIGYNYGYSGPLRPAGLSPTASPTAAGYPATEAFAGDEVPTDTPTVDVTISDGDAPKPTTK